MVAPEHIRGQHHALVLRISGTRGFGRMYAQRGEIRQQSRSSRRHLEAFLPIRIPVIDGFRVTVQTQGVVTPGRDPNHSSGPIREFITQHLPSIGRKQIAGHRSGHRIRCIPPVENHIHSDRGCMIVTKFLMFAGCQNCKNGGGYRTETLFHLLHFHRLPPFFAL